MSPVSVETEFSPAATVELDARARLGEVFKPTGGTIHSALAVKYPIKYKTMNDGDISSCLEAEENLAYSLVYGENSTHFHRWPTSGYLYGTVTDIAGVISNARVSPIAVEKGASTLENGARILAAMLETAAASHPKLGADFSDCLRQSISNQTYAMASTILINAFVFQDTLAGSTDALSEISSLAELTDDNPVPSRGKVVAAWNKILKVNYWPIFGISRSLLKAIPAPIWAPFITECLNVADSLLSLNLGKNPDLVGTIFQRLISDRRFLATFYTAPSSAALMARLLVGNSPPHGGSWNDLERVRDLRIADFACGTGSLLCSVYGEVRTRVENAGGDSGSIHRWMIENSIVGCDVIPSATHITASQLTSAFPSILYKKTKILTMPFGRLDDGGVALGALDLLERQAALSTISTSSGAVGAHSEAEIDAWKELGGTAVNDQSFDLVAMNPPFTRLTGGGGKSDEVSRPLFAAFGTTEADQQAMARRATRLFGQTAYHGNAGAASAFVEIGHRKLRTGGRVGLILPLSAMSGISWDACRELWRRNYRDLIVVSIASYEASASAFSADTGVAECLILGTRADKPDGRALSVTLFARPTSRLDGETIGGVIDGLRFAGSVRRLEDGPYGGTSIQLGDEKIGEAVSMPLTGGPWLATRIRDHALAQVAYQLFEMRKVWLPSASSPIEGAGPFCPLKELGEAGPYHLDVGSGTLSGGGPRGPFEVRPTLSPASITYPVLAAHDETRERHVEIDADAEGVLREGSSPQMNEVIKQRFEAIWATRTRLHFSTDTRFNANGLIAALTKREAVGGRAWPSFLLHQRKFEKVVVLWFNSSLGILSYWWLATKSQDGRGSVTTTRLGDLLSFDPRAMTDEEILAADTFFDEFRLHTLQDIHECGIDPRREELDRFVASHFLKASSNLSTVLNQLQLVRAKLALEPSITGGRSVS